MAFQDTRLVDSCSDASRSFCPLLYLILNLKDVTVRRNYERLGFDSSRMMYFSLS